MTKKFHFDSAGIIGCGWLGTPLAKQLISSGTSIIATSSQTANVDNLNKQGITAQQLLLPGDDASLSNHNVFAQQVLIIAITPGFKQKRTDYNDKVEQLVNAARLANKVQRIILISSTAVYNGLQGTVNESSELNFGAEKVEILHQAEQTVLNFNKSSCVLRLAGLLGPSRHPGSFLINKTHSVNNVLTNGKAKINLIHQQDAIGLILALLSNQSISGVFNGVSETHVTKEFYYKTAAKKIGIAPPNFEGCNNEVLTRVVCGSKADEQLCYQFVYPDVLDWL